MTKVFEIEREKMIEEMAKDIHNAKRLSDYHCYEDEYTDCKKCKFLKYAENKMCQDAYEACFLIENNYRKIPDGAVVLTKEDFNKIICDIMDKNNVDDNKRIFITLLSIELEKYIFKGVSK